MAVISCYYPTSNKMNHNKWLNNFEKGVRAYEKLAGYKIEAGFYGWVVSFIKSLLKKQREEQVKEVGTLLVVDVEQEIKPYDAQLIMEMKANHNEMVRKYNLAITKVLSILKGNKK